jgi:hypothetical protein
MFCHGIRFLLQYFLYIVLLHICFVYLVFCLVYLYCFVFYLYHCAGFIIGTCAVFFFLRGEGAPQQMLRTHHSLKVFCATPLMKMSSFFYQVLQVMEHQWNEIDRGKPATRKKNLSQCHFVHHKSHMDLTWDRTYLCC